MRAIRKELLLGGYGDKEGKNPRNVPSKEEGDKRNKIKKDIAKRRELIIL